MRSNATLSRARPLMLQVLSVVCVRSARQLPAADAVVADSTLTMLPVAHSRQLQGNAKTTAAKDPKVRKSYDLPSSNS
jgi:hypothetical protein